MKLLVEELEDLSLELKEVKNEIQRLNKLYSKFFDRDLRKDIDENTLLLRKLQRRLTRFLYSSIGELKLIKKHFPKLFSELKDDPILSPGISRISWLLNFKELSENKAKEELDKIKLKRNQLRRIKKEVTSFVEINYNSLKNYDLLDEIIDKKPDKIELLDFIKKKGKSLKREGWLVLINEPFINDYIKNYLTHYKELLSIENDQKKIYEEAGHHGTLTESMASNDYLSSKKARLKLEKRCKHMLYANPDYLKKLKSSKRLHKTFDTSDFNFFDSVRFKMIKEEDWLKEMNKLLES